jgi:hypothetical protein
VDGTLTQFTSKHRKNAELLKLCYFAGLTLTEADQKLSDHARQRSPLYTWPRCLRSVHSEHWDAACVFSFFSVTKTARSAINTTGQPYERKSERQ